MHIVYNLLGCIANITLKTYNHIKLCCKAFGVAQWLANVLSGSKVGRLYLGVGNYVRVDFKSI